MHVPVPESILATSFDGHAIEAISSGASMQGNTIITGAATMRISGTAISPDSFHRIYLGGTPYQSSHLQSCSNNNNTDQWSCC